MALIEKLTKLRFDNFLKEFNIDIDFNIITKINWYELKQKIIEHGYGTNNYNFYDCFFVIKNIVWKNIVTFDIIDKNLHVNMYHNNYKYISCIYYDFCDSYNSLFCHISHCKTFYENFKLKDNCIILQRKIINYIILLDILVTKYLITDLVYSIKNYMFYVMLLI